jgi:hypothetical protein
MEGSTMKKVSSAGYRLQKGEGAFGPYGRKAKAFSSLKPGNPWGKEMMSCSSTSREPKRVIL